MQSLSASDVLSGFRTDRLGLSLTMPLFRGGALRQNVKAQNALVDQALASYESTVLAAYEEVENALTASSNEDARHEALQQGVESARRASELALTQYNSGLVDFQTVLDADRQLLVLEDSLAVSDGEIDREPGSPLQGAGRRLVSLPEGINRPWTLKRIPRRRLPT